MAPLSLGCVKWLSFWYCKVKLLWISTFILIKVFQSFKFPQSHSSCFLLWIVCPPEKVTLVCRSSSASRQEVLRVKIYSTTSLLMAERSEKLCLAPGLSFLEVWGGVGGGILQVNKQHPRASWTRKVTLVKQHKNYRLLGVGETLSFNVALASSYARPGWYLWVVEMCWPKGLKGAEVNSLWYFFEC